MRWCIIWMFVLPLAVAAQNGIVFEKGLRWQQVLEKAKREHKFIFVDCFATWCGPCKLMDRDVYPTKEVGQVFNEHFISVRMQMDSSHADGADVRAAYADAHWIKEQYKPGAYPTFLFLDPDGRLTYDAAGFRDVSDFVDLAKEVMDPDKNYYLSLERYKNGDHSAERMSTLALRGLVLGDTANAQSIARNYLDTYGRDRIFSNDHINFMKAFTHGTTDPGFAFFFRNADTIDAVEQNDEFAEGIIHALIFREEVLPVMIQDSTKGTSPDWNVLLDKIKVKYGDYYARRVILSSKSSWGLWRKDWKMYTKFLVQYMEEYCPKKAPLLDVALNNHAWVIFTYSNDKQELETALKWTGRAILIEPYTDYMDTYANLLYKLGEVENARKWEAIAVKTDPENNEKKYNAERMKNGLPTWPEMQ